MIGIRLVLSCFILLAVQACSERIAAPSPPAAQTPSASDAAPPVGQNLLQNPGFESGDPALAPWTMAAHADSESFLFELDTGVARQGSASLRVRRVKDEPFASATQHLRSKAVGHRKLRFSAWIKGDGLASEVYPHAAFFGYGAQLGLVDGQGRGQSGSFDWTRLELDFELPEHADRFEVGITTTGDGTLWIDDAELVALPD